MATTDSERGLQTSLSKWPQRPDSASVRKALEDRMTFSEVLEAASGIIASYPSGKPANERGYLGAISSVLAEYPRQVVARCSSPLQGIVRECKFLPSVAELVAWCEREKAGLERLAESREAIEKPKVGYPIGGKPGDQFPEPSIGAATRTGLMQRYRITAIPPGWDAIDVCQAAAKHGEGLQACIDNVMAGRTPDLNRGAQMQSIGEAAAKAWKAMSDDDLRARYAGKRP